MGKKNASPHVTHVFPKRPSGLAGPGPGDASGIKWTANTEARPPVKTRGLTPAALAANEVNNAAQAAAHRFISPPALLDTLGRHQNEEEQQEN
jgi:hypothetical protein